MCKYENVDEDGSSAVKKQIISVRHPADSASARPKSSRACWRACVDLYMMQVLPLQSGDCKAAELPS